MKKLLVASILGLALNVASSFGQGYILMQNYDRVGSTPVYSGITYGIGLKAGEFVGSEFSVDLLWSDNGGATYSLTAGSLTGIIAGSTDGGTPTTDGAGSFFGPTVTIPGYTSGPVEFIVRAFDGTGYGSPTTSYEGESAPFVINSLQTSSLGSAGDLLQLNGTTPTGLQPFTVDPVPEPSVFTLAGLGAAALMTLRRRK